MLAAFIEFGCHLLRRTVPARVTPEPLSSFPSDAQGNFQGSRGALGTGESLCHRHTAAQSKPALPDVTHIPWIFSTPVPALQLQGKNFSPVFFMSRLHGRQTVVSAHQND